MLERGGMGGDLIMEDSLIEGGGNLFARSRTIFQGLQELGSSGPDAPGQSYDGLGCLVCPPRRTLHPSVQLL